MATRGLHQTFVYAAVDATTERPIDDAKSNHQITAIVGGMLIPVPQDAIHALGAPGLFHANIAVDGPSVSLLGHSTTEGVRIKFLPTVHFDYLPHAAAGEVGGLLLRGHAPGCIEPADGMVPVSHVAKNAISGESFRTDAIDDRVIAANAMHDTVFGPGAISHTVVTDSFRQMLVELLTTSGKAIATDASGRVLLSSGTKDGQVNLRDGVVTAKSADRILTVEDLANAMRSIVTSVKTDVQEATSSLARKSDIPQPTRAEDLLQALADSLLQSELQSLSTAIDSLERATTNAAAQYRNDSALQSTTTQTRFHDISDALFEIHKTLTSRPKVTVAELSDQDGEDVARLKAILSDGPGAKLNASLSGNVEGTINGLTQNAHTELRDDLYNSFTQDRFPEPTGAPGSKASLVEMIHWIYTLYRNGREEFRTPDGKRMEGVRNDAGSTFIARRELTQPDDSTKVSGKWQG